LKKKKDLAKDKEIEFRRKVFLGGLNKKTNENALEIFFSKFGDIEDILINRNISDGSSKGCAFLLFEEISVAQKLIESEEIHLIDGNYVEVKQCFEKTKMKNFEKNEEKPFETHNYDGNFFSQLQQFLLAQGMFQMNFNSAPMPPMLQNMPQSVQQQPQNFSNSGDFYSQYGQQTINGNWGSFPAGHLQGYDNMSQIPMDAFFEKCPVAKIIMKEPKGYHKQPEVKEETNYEERESFMEVLKGLKNIQFFHNLQNLRLNSCVNYLLKPIRGGFSGSKGYD